MSDQDCTKDLSADIQREKKRSSRESDENLNLENDSSFESESESVKAKKVRVSDTTEEKESGLVVEKGNGFLEKTVSRENDVSLEEVGSCSGGCSSTEKREVIMVFDDDDEERVGKIDIDLNFPPLEVVEDDEGEDEEGETESESEDIEYEAKGGIMYSDGKRVEDICIDSEVSEDEGEGNVGGREIRNKDEEEIEGRHVTGRLGSFGIDLGRMKIDLYAEGSSSMSGTRRYTKEEKGKGKVSDDWLSIATAGSLDLDQDKGKLWIGP